jgi:HSP20 family protein
MLTRWNPMRDMMNMQDTIDAVFNEAWRPLYDNNLALDIDESNHAYTVRASVPGIKPEDISISINDNILTIQGETESESEHTEQNGTRVIMRERRVGRFSRSVRLQEPVSVEEVEAEYENGVLTLSLPKTEVTEDRRIPIIVR